MISVIITVLNEGESIRRLMDSLAGQSCRPDEVVIVDGGSQDNTVAILQEYADRLPLRVFVEPGANISRGRNAAIERAQGDILAITDAGVVLARDWLECITRPLIANPTRQVVGGFFEAEARTVFEAAMGATVLPLAREIDAATFLPSSRSIAVRKSAWEQVGGYPEWLDYCEDLIFDLRLKQLGAFAFEPGARVLFRPRGSLRSFFKQYYRYARGDGKADLWRKRHAARYATYLVAVPAIAALGALVHPLLWGLYVPSAAVYMAQPYRRLPAVMRRAGYRNPFQIAYAALLVPLIRVVGDIAKMLGYPAGWAWRLKNKPPQWKRL